VTTHWHMDHFGGVAGLARMVKISHFWDRGLPEDADARPDFPDGPKPNDPLGIAYRSASAGKRKALKAGDSLPLKEVRARILASGGRVIDPATIGQTTADAAKLANPLCENAPPDLPVDPSDNARSLAILFSLGKFQFFDAGDLTWNVERQLVCPVDLIGPVDLYQVTHHGMDISNHPTLVMTIAPVVAIMNNGPRKGGAPGTVKLLRSIPSIQAAYQLHKNAATGDEDNTAPSLIANKDESGGEFIRVRIAPDGARFTVQIGEHGTERTFESR
jgi:competence protein ComEC